VIEKLVGKMSRKEWKKYCSRDRLLWEKNKVMTLGHLAGIIAAEEL